MFCRKCGKEIDSSSNFCEFCGNSTNVTQDFNSNKGSDPSLKPNESQKQNVATVPTSQGKRFMNYILDYIFILICYVILYALFDTSSGTSTGEEGGDSFLIYLFYLIYYVFFEGIWQKTPAKLLTRTKVITKEGEKPTLGVIIIRSLCRLIPFDNFSYLSTNPVGWHDSISKTLVVNE